jgi:hypothetical protein
MNVKEKHKKEIEELIIDAATIRTATGYHDNYLKRGNVCDSSVRNGIRMEYVRKAEKEFLENHTEDILQRAADIILEDIG